MPLRVYFMLTYLIQRTLGLVVTMFLVSIMVFVIMELPPGDYAESYAFRKFSGTGTRITETDLANIRAEFGLDRPMWERYITWVGGIVTRFDFGEAFAFQAPVTQVIGQKVFVTLGILFGTLISTYLISIPIGMYAAVRRNSVEDYSLTVFSYLGLAAPNFLVALILLYVGATVFDVSVGGLLSPEFEGAPWNVAKIADLLSHLGPAAAVLAWSATAFQLQTVRATMLDELNKLSVVAARARGLPEWKLLLKYPARLAINPVISTIGFDVNRIFSELPIVATVLLIPELGQLLLASYLGLDMYVAGAILLLLTFMIVFMNFLSDIALAYLDPRARVTGG